MTLPRLWLDLGSPTSQSGRLGYGCTCDRSELIRVNRRSTVEALSLYQAVVAAPCMVVLPTRDTRTERWTACEGKALTLVAPTPVRLTTRFCTLRYGIVAAPGVVVRSPCAAGP